MNRKPTLGRGLADLLGTRPPPRSGGGTRPSGQRR